MTKSYALRVNTSEPGVIRRRNQRKSNFTHSTTAQPAWIAPEVVIVWVDFATGDGDPTEGVRGRWTERPLLSGCSSQSLDFRIHAVIKHSDIHAEGARSRGCGQRGNDQKGREQRPIYMIDQTTSALVDPVRGRSVGLVVIIIRVWGGGVLEYKTRSDRS